MTSLRLLVLFLVGPAVVVMDIRHRRIPNRLLFLLTIATLAIYIAWPRELMSASLAGLVCALVLLPLFLSGWIGIGAGDIKLMIILALLLGNGGRVLTAFTLASLLACGQLLYTRISRGSFHRTIAFAPALVIGSLLCV